MEELQTKSNHITLSNATNEDADDIFKVVLEAYIIELGDSGIAFKTKNRYLSVDQVKEDIRVSREIIDGSDKPSTVYLVARN